jgi:lipoyl(octanoyl) transferase
MEVRRLGIVDYQEALALQHELRERVLGGGEEVLLLLEHPPVYTLGRRSQPGDLPMGEAWYRAQGIDVVRTERGGKLTYHGPGQLVGYPIVRVRDVGAFVCRLEDAIAEALAPEGIDARGRSREGVAYAGVWVQDRKIASIGLHVSRGVSTHGFALNVDNDLQPFEWAVACGLPEVRMTSVCRETGRSGTLPAIASRVAAALGSVPSQR